MMVMRYSNIDYAVVYVDPSRSASGTGETPETALRDLPASAGDIPDNTCYIIRRTAEESACALPSGTNRSVGNCIIMGMPIASDLAWELVPAEARAAWGADTEAYANVRTTSSGASLQLPAVRQFVLHRVHLARDGVDASAYLLRFDNSTEGVGCYLFDHCRFGSRGIDVDLASHTGEVASSRLCGYVYINRARMLGVTDTTLNHAVCGYSSYGHGVYCKWADVLDVENVRVFSPASTSSSQYYPLFLCDADEEGVECVIRNVSQTIRLNGTSGQYVPTLLKVQGYISMTVGGVSVRTGEPLSSARPSSYSVGSYPLLSFQNVREVNADGFDLEYADCWNCGSRILEFSRCYASTYVPGVSKRVRNVSVVLASENGIGNPISYANAVSSGNNYAAVELSFSSGDGEVFAKAVQVDGVRVVNPRGKALHCESVRLTDCEVEGTVNLNASVADIKSLATWFPGKALNAYDGTHVRVGELVCNTENDLYPFDEDPAVGTTFDDEANVFVESSNTALRPMTALTSEAERIYQGFGCNNEGADGHFAYRCGNALCDTWSVRREGGGAAALKLYNNFRSGAGTMVLGRRPFNGMQLLPTTTGRHILRAHIAFKGYAKPEELYRHLFLSAEVGGRTLHSTLHGRWADDADAVWVNDSELTQMVLEMPLDIADTSPVDVRVYFSWYSAGGFVYLDPDIELAEAPE